MRRNFEHKVKKSLHSLSKIVQQFDIARKISHRFFMICDKVLPLFFQTFLARITFVNNPRRKLSSNGRTFTLLTAGLCSKTFFIVNSKNKNFS